MENTSAELCETHSLASSSPSMMSLTTSIHNNNRFAGQEKLKNHLQRNGPGNNAYTHIMVSLTNRRSSPYKSKKNKEKDSNSRHLSDRSQKLKDARGEAAKEIETLKSKREDEFKEFEQQIEVIKSEFNKNKAQVVSDLLSKVTDVQPELHRNYKLGIHQLK
ncbi:H(+)-transporting V1 sector ATPase subunit G [Puccinia graminis f. sp. tritici]|uniref:H(+)-transporting V1 sector ATPase subunit G n=1 Tax=Puccinia graminis f. sp. tritici TaxID=56615 RepID=A0A5B0P3B8_PUCGR|nr:H(+)-transporting V1 sector ATPase subunit G [Puccinia graminis f. sp. tritici]